LAWFVIETLIYPDADLYDTSILRTLFITFDNDKWEEELAAFNKTET